MNRAEIMRRLKYGLRFLPDEMYIRLYYAIHVRRKLNLNHPVSFNEKLQWLKFNDRNPFYAVVVDKYAVRDYIKETIGEKYLIPLLGEWKSVEEINFADLPEQFVLKCNHDSGGLVVCTDKKNLNIKKAKKKIKSSLKRQFYYIGREWQYKNIKPRILCEAFIGSNDCLPADYKISCFNGEPDNIMVCQGRETGLTRYYFFDLDWNFLPYDKHTKELQGSFTLPKPENLDVMIQIARELSKPFVFSRIDLYNIEGKVYFGEITLCPNSGFDVDILPEIDNLLGKKLHLPIIDD